LYLTFPVDTEESRSQFLEGDVPVRVFCQIQQDFIFPVGETQILFPVELFGVYRESDRRSVMVNVSRLRKRFEGNYELENRSSTVSCSREGERKTGREFCAMVRYLLSENDTLWTRRSRCGSPIEHPDRDITFEELGTALFGVYRESDRRSVMVNVSRLRKRFEGNYELDSCCRCCRERLLAFNCAVISSSLRDSSSTVSCSREGERTVSVCTGYRRCPHPDRSPDWDTGTSDPGYVRVVDLEDPSHAFSFQELDAPAFLEEYFYTALPDSHYAGHLLCLSVSQDLHATLFADPGKLIRISIRVRAPSISCADRDCPEVR